MLTYISPYKVIHLSVAKEWAQLLVIEHFIYIIYQTTGTGANVVSFTLIVKPANMGTSCAARVSLTFLLLLLIWIQLGQHPLAQLEIPGMHKV